MLILVGVYFLTAFCAHSQESTGRLSVAPVATAPAASPAPAVTPAPTPTQQPVAKAPEPTSNVVDAPLPEVANQPKVITPSQTSSPDGPTGPRDGRWYIGGAGGAMVQQIVENGSVTAIGQVPLQQEDSGQLGGYAALKVGYDFAIRDVQLAFGGPTPMRTAMELELNYMGCSEKQDVYPQGAANVGLETFNLTAYSAILNGLIKFEDLPITPYFGGGVGASVLYVTNHKLEVNGIVNGTETEYITNTASANNVCLALQAIVGIERQIYQNLSIFIEYRFLAYMDPQFAFGNEQTPLGANGIGGSNSSSDFIANQIISSGLKWSF
jgi:opacity protein-like surface antigen